jgi:hypothetical protein
MGNKNMRDALHLTDEQLLRAADREISSRDGARILTHLATCESCRARGIALERTLTDLQGAYREAIDPQVPLISVPRAVLRARLAELAAEELQNASWWRFLRIPSLMPAATVVCLICLSVVTAAKFHFPHSSFRGANNAPAFRLDRAAIPDSHLTPGVARPVSLGEVCSMAHEQVEKDVPGSLRAQVFQEYGIAGARADDYEIDYLIAPGLGGTEDIRNLWPEPYGVQTWNAHVKDGLEEHLHELVCSGRLDLLTAQKDISSDWIAAYKKYFRTDKPLDRPVDERVVSLGRHPGKQAKLEFVVYVRPTRPTQTTRNGTRLS